MGCSSASASMKPPRVGAFSSFRCPTCGQWPATTTATWLQPYHLCSAPRVTTAQTAQMKMQPVAGKRDSRSQLCPKIHQCLKRDGCDWPSLAMATNDEPGFQFAETSKPGTKPLARLGRLEHVRLHAHPNDGSCLVQFVHWWKLCPSRGMLV